MGSTITVKDSKRCIGIKLCGNCNPDFEVKSLLRKLEEILSASFVSYLSEDAELILCINSCISSCNAKMIFEKKSLVVNGYTFRGKRFESIDLLVESIANEILNIEKIN